MSERHDNEEPMSDKQLRQRTTELLAKAEQVSMTLALQTERLSAAIDMFDREIIVPLRKGLRDDD
jgi:dihydroorotase